MAKRRRKDKAVTPELDLEPLYLTPDEEAAARLDESPSMFAVIDFVQDGQVLRYNYTVLGCDPYFIKVSHQLLGSSCNALVAMKGDEPTGSEPSLEIATFNEYLARRVKGLPCDAASLRLAGALVRAWRKKVGDDPAVAEQGPGSGDSGAGPSGGAT